MVEKSGRDQDSRKWSNKYRTPKKFGFSPQVHFREIPSHVLQKVCHYFAYKARYTNSATEIPEFYVAPEVALELLMAANFLDC